MLTARQAADFLLSRDHYLILTHTRPDGDTLGCAAALCARFGGGGHAEAAGCILCGLTLDEAKRAIRNAVEA